MVTFEELFAKSRSSESKCCTRLSAIPKNREFYCPAFHKKLSYNSVESYCLRGLCSQYHQKEETFDDIVRKSKQFKGEYCDNMFIDEEHCCIKCLEDESMLCKETIQSICSKDGLDDVCDNKHITVEDCKPYDELEISVINNDVNFYDYCTTQETVHKVYSTMLNPSSTCVPQDYTDFYDNAERENAVLHKLNCLICTLKLSGNKYAENLEYFTYHDMENIERDFARKLRIEL